MGDVPDSWSEGAGGSSEPPPSGWPPPAPPPHGGDPGQPPPPYGAPPGYPTAPGYPTPPGYAGAYGPQAWGVAPKANSRSTTSLVLGIVSFFVCPVLLSIAAIVEGKKARKEIAASNGMETGEGNAKAGVVLGTVSLVLYGGMALLFVAVALLGTASESGFSTVGTRIEVPCDNTDEYTYNDC